MSTWWSVVPRDDLGLGSRDLAARPFSITNRAWYVLHRFLVSMGARGTDLLVEKETFLSSRLLVHWGQCIAAIAPDHWYLVGRFNGRTVVADGIISASDPRVHDERLELTPLIGTPTFMWLLEIGQELSSTPTGYLMTGKPRKGSPMSQSLVKGEKVNLQELATKAGATGGLTKVKVGAGWDVRKGEGPEFDLDLVAIGCDANGKAVSDDWRIFFNNVKAPADAIIHSGDNLTGAGEGDDEVITIDLSAVPAEVVDIRIYVTIYAAAARGNLNFGQVDNAFVRIVDASTDTELVRYDLTEDAGPVQSVEMAKIYKHDGAWDFKALANKYSYELGQVFASH